MPSQWSMGTGRKTRAVMVFGFVRIAVLCQRHLRRIFCIDTVRTAAHGWTERKVNSMTDYPTREYIIRETTYPDAIKLEAIGKLVRCKDCQYWKRDHELDGYPLFEGHMVCKYAIGHSYVRYPHDFCSKGVRKDCNNEAD